MRIVLQLLREFWLPLLLGVAWTAYNFFDRPLAKWTVREVVNVFGPTFFFMSWLVAQWYRVRKQQRVEDGLSEIQRDVRAMHDPVFPCGVFLSLRMDSTENDMDSLFRGAAGHRAFSPDKPPPPPPIGLPPGTANGRVIHQYDYFEYADGTLVGAGFFKLDQPGYNPFEGKVRHTVSALSREEVADAKQRNHPLLTAPSVELEILFSGKTKSVKLIDAPKTHEVGDVLALDTNVQVDHVFKMVANPSHQSLNWSVADLRGSTLRLVLRFFFLEGFSSLPRESWPSLKNFQLWLGPRADRVLSLDPQRLEPQTIQRDHNSIFKGQALTVELRFETAIDDATYSKCLLAAA